MSNNTALFDHVQTVSALANVGIEPPPAWVELRQRHTDYLALQFPIRGKLVDAILSGTGDIEALRALAAAEGFAQTGTQANAHIEHAVLHRLKELYDGPAAYRAIVAKFDDAAAHFKDAAAHCDPDADGATLVGTPERKQRAWLNAALHAAELSKLCIPLCAAATLCGCDIHASDAPRLLPLCVTTADITGKRRRTLWDAWDSTDGRCGRWSAIQRAGFEIKALANLDQHTEYRRALPIQRVQEQIPGKPAGTIRWREIDPEERHPEPIDPRRPSKRAVIA